MAATTTPRTVLITGASSGIGKALSQRFAKDRHSLILVARREQALEALATQLRQQFAVDVHVLAQDLSIPGAAGQLFERIHQAGLQVEILVNNAGFGVNGAFAERPLPEWQSMIQLNIATLTELTHLAISPMQAAGFGRILNVASVVSFMPCPNFAVYAASKAYVLSFSEALNHELRGTDVNVTSLCPGATATEFHAVAGNQGTLLTRLMDSPELVAETAYAALWQQKSAVVSGWMNKPLPLLVRLSPKALVLRLAARMAKHAA